jgi:hypothetical protein
MGKRRSRFGEDVQTEYIPTRSEIRRRAKDLRWMKFQGFTMDFIYLVMVQNRPPIERIVKLRREGIRADRIEKNYRKRCA